MQKVYQFPRKDGLRCSEKLGQNQVFSLLQELHVAIVAVGSAGRRLYELKELTQVLSLGGRKVVKTKTNTVSGATAGHDSAESEALNPDFPVWHPEPDFDLGSGFYRRCRFNQAAACAGVGKIAPDGV